MSRTICAVITARPSYSRVKTALRAMQAHPGIELRLVVAASALLDRYGTAARIIEDDGFPIAAKVYSVLEGENPAAMAKTTGLGLMELATVFDNLRPDVVLTVADRFETMATAVAAAYMNIPLAHVQGGEVTGSIDEKVRHSITKLADLHFVATALAAERVIRMGEDPATVFVTGCPSIDIALEMRRAPDPSFDPIRRYGGVGADLDLRGGYLVAMQHPVTTEHELARQQMASTLHALASFDMPTLVFWPNVDAGADGTSNAIRTFRELERPTQMHFFKNMTPTDFLRLLDGAACLVGNSSVGVREAAYLGVPVVNIGTRQTGRERGGNVRDAGYDAASIRQAIAAQLTHGRYAQDALYGDGAAGGRIARLLAEVPLHVEKRLMY